MPGCELTAKRPDLGGADAGPDDERTWCVGGRYRVDVAFADRLTLELLHQELTVVPG
jgi:hypothetical protein